MMYEPIETPGAPRRRNGVGIERWCILRMGSSRTLIVAASLSDAGIDAWAPKVVLRRRRPRSSSKTEIDLPLLPSFVFVAERDLNAIYHILAMPVSPHPQFSLFRQAGRVPLLVASQIESLRLAEADAAEALAEEKERERLKEIKDSRPPVPAIGTRVKVSSTAFSGIVGEVTADKGGAAIVNFGAGQCFTIEAWHLEELPVEDQPSPGPEVLISGNTAQAVRRANRSGTGIPPSPQSTGTRWDARAAIRKNVQSLRPRGTPCTN